MSAWRVARLCGTFAARISSHVARAAAAASAARRRPPPRTCPARTRKCTRLARAACCRAPPPAARARRPRPRWACRRDGVTRHARQEYLLTNGLVTNGGSRARWRRRRRRVRRRKARAAAAGSADESVVGAQRDVHAGIARGVEGVEREARQVRACGGVDEQRECARVGRDAPLVRHAVETKRLLDARLRRRRARLQ